ncbi:MAG: hypothetical protein M3Y39_19695 [Chloroflexota bacterium]|nr:hypothetical protein [Chloroflexota bacterium]
MRGKLRDKRTTTMRETFKRELIERKRPTSRRDSRPVTWLDALEDENIDIEFVEEEQAETANKK